jgi:hypothetical protein
MTMVKHPAIERAVKDVPEEDVQAWLEQGWLLEEGNPEVAETAPVENPRVAPPKRRKRR